MEQYRLQFIVGAALCGILIMSASFGPWLRFRSISGEDITPEAPKASVTVSGAHISRWRDKDSLLQNQVQDVDGWCSCRVTIGDGYLTAALGVVLVGAAILAFFTGWDRPAGMAGVAASLGALGVAGYNGIASWHAYVWTELQALEVTRGVVQPPLYIVIGAAAVAAAFSGLLWGAGAQEVHEELLEEEEKEEGAPPPMYSVFGGASWA